MSFGEQKQSPLENVIENTLELIIQKCLSKVHVDIFYAVCYYKSLYILSIREYTFCMRKITLDRRIDSDVALIIRQDSSAFLLSMNTVPQSQHARPNGPKYKISFFETTLQLSIANHNLPRTNVTNFITRA